MVHKKGISLFIVLVQMNFIQRKHFSKANVTSHVFLQIYDLKIFPECLRGPQAACSWTTLAYDKTVIYYRGVV